MKSLRDNIIIPFILISATSIGFIGCDAEDFVFTRGPIRCDNGVINIDREGNDLLIDGIDDITGQQGDCIMAEINCAVNIRAEDIILTNCVRCISARNIAEVTITALSGDIRCNAEGDGIRTEGNAVVGLNAEGIADGDVTITSTGGNGVRADDMSAVELNATQKCTIEGAESAIVQNDTAVVNTGGCNELELIEGM